MITTTMIGCINGWRIDKNEYVDEGTGEILHKTYTPYQWVLAPVEFGGERWRELGTLTSEDHARTFWEGAKSCPVFGIDKTFDGNGRGNIRFDEAIHHPTTGEKDMSVHFRDHDFVYRG